MLLYLRRAVVALDFVEKDYDGRMPLVMGEARLTRARSYWNALALAPTWLEWFAPL